MCMKRNKNEREIVPKGTMTKLWSIIVIAVGNVLIIVGESLISYSQENIKMLEGDKSKNEITDNSDDFFGL